MVTVMKILLAIDESACSQAATKAVIAQFPRDRADVRVLNVDEWPNRLPTSLAFAEGPTAASDILDVRQQRRRQGEEVVGRAHNSSGPPDFTPARPFVRATRGTGFSKTPRNGART